VIETERRFYEFSRSTVYLIKGTNMLHRDDGPAVEYISGLKEWWINGKLHRDDGPAVINPKMSMEWYKDGKRHREDGPAVIYFSGDLCWILNDIYFNKKEKWFEALTEEQKIKALHSEYFIGSWRD